MKNRVFWRLFAVMMLVLVTVSAFAGCNKETPAQTTEISGDMKIYWNVDRDQYVAKGMYGVSARIPRDDGRYYIRFAVDGIQIDLAVEGIELVNKIDNLDYMGLEINEEGVVVEAYQVDEFTGGLAADCYFVEKIEGTKVTVNTAGSMKGVSVELEIPEGTPMYNVGESGLLVGTPVAELSQDDEIIAIKDTDGKIFTVFVAPYKVPGPVYWNINRMYDSTTGISTRTADPMGYYNFDFAIDGGVTQLRTKDPEVANAIDKQAARCMALEFDEEGLITATASYRVETGGQTVASWYHIMDVVGDDVTAERTIGGSEQGNVVNCHLSKYSKVVNTTTGEYTEPRVGDQIHCLTDSRGNIAYMFIISRLNANAKIGLNVERKWNSTLTDTTRVPDAEGYYHITIAADGEHLNLKTTDKNLIVTVDRNAARCFAFEHEGDILTGVYGTGVSTGGGTVLSWYDLDSVENGTVTATKRTDTSSSEYGKTASYKMASDCVVYDLTGVSGKVGNITELKDGDRIHCLTNIKGELKVIVVVNRPREGTIYWNVYRKYNSTTKSTTRTPDAQGYYHYEMCGNGKTYQLKTNQKELADKIDSQAARCWALSLNGDIICDVYAVSSTIDGAGGTVASWVHVTECSNVDAETIKNSTGTDNGNTYYIEYAPNVKIYNISDDYETVRGEKTTLRVGDQIHCIRNGQGQTTYIWVISRGPENGYMAKCNMCEKEVLWSAWDGTKGLAGGVHYYLEQDVQLSTYKTISGGKVSLFLNGHTISSDSRVFKLSSGTTLNLYDSMIDGSDIGGKLIGKGLTTQEAKDEQNGTSEGGVIILWGSNVFNLYSGTLQLADDHNTVNYGGVVAGNGTFNMYGGKLTGGEVNRAGGTMRRYGSSTVTNIYGGIIENGYTDGNGGHISAGGAGCKVNIYGGTFIGGNAKGTGDDIWMEANTYLTLGGKVNLSDVVIQSTATVEKLEEGSSIGISISDITKPAATLEDPADAQYFKATSKIQDVELQGNDLYLVTNLKPHDHCVCAGLTKGVGDHTACANETWTPWTSTTSLPQTSGNYYLLEDVNASGFTMPNDADIKLCLNGFDVEVSSVIWLKGNFTVTDCTGAGTIYGMRSGHSCAFYTYELSNLYLYAGTISGEKATGKNFAVINLCDDDRNGNGSRERSQMHMYGGTIIGRDATGYQGAAVRLMLNTQFNMYGGTITGGKSDYGSAVYMDSAAGTVNLQGGTITGGMSNKGAVYAKYGTLIIGGDMQITGNTAMDGTTPSNVYLDGNVMIDLSGLGSGASLGISMANPGVFAQDTQDLTTQIISDSTNCKVVYTDNSMVLQEKNPPHKHCDCGGNAKGMTDHSCADVTWTAWTSTTSLPTASGYYYLTDDVNVSADTRLSGADVHICLNGFDITSTSRVYRLANSAKLSFTDHKSGGVFGGTVSGMGLKQSEIAGDGNGGATEGGLFMQYNSNTQLHIYGGNFTFISPTDGRTVCKNGGILQGGGLLKIYDGVLTGGYVTGSGGVIRSWGTNTRFYFYGGTIKGGNAGGTGGNISINSSSSGAQIYFGNVTITGGTAGSVGGVYLDKYVAKVTLAGTPNITGNSGANLYLSTGLTLTLDATLTTDARVGICMQTDGEFATARTDADKIIFTSDKSANAVILEDNKLKIA